MLVVIQMTVLLAVRMMSSPVMMAPAYPDHGNAMLAGVTVQVMPVKMKPIVVVSLKVVPMVNSHVMTAHAYLDHGNVMYTIVIVLDAKMKPTVVVKRNV
jgi:hypothetical protein